MQPRRALHRRTVVAGAAWTAPVVVLATTTPAYAGSGTGPPPPPSWKVTGSYAAEGVYDVAPVPNGTAYLSLQSVAPPTFGDWIALLDLGTGATTTVSTAHLPTYVASTPDGSSVFYRGNTAPSEEIGRASCRERV